MSRLVPLSGIFWNSIVDSSQSAFGQSGLDSEVGDQLVNNCQLNMEKNAVNNQRSSKIKLEKIQRLQKWCFAAEEFFKTYHLIWCQDSIRKSGSRKMLGRGRATRECIFHIGKLNFAYDLRRPWETPYNGGELE